MQGPKATQGCASASPSRQLDSSIAIHAIEVDCTILSYEATMRHSMGKACTGCIQLSTVAHPGAAKQQPRRSGQILETNETDVSGRGGG